MRYFLSRALVAVAICGLAGCAIAVQPEQITRAPSGAEYHLLNTLVGSPSGGRKRRLDAGSSWRVVGTIAEGDVYRPVGTVLTIQDFDIHEAYIVVRDGMWVGFWLPVENSFVALSDRIAIQLSPGK